MPICRYANTIVPLINSSAYQHIGTLAHCPKSQAINYTS